MAIWSSYFKKIPGVLLQSPTKTKLDYTDNFKGEMFMSLESQMTSPKNFCNLIAALKKQSNQEVYAYWQKSAAHAYLCVRFKSYEEYKIYDSRARAAEHVLTDRGVSFKAEGVLADEEKHRVIDT